MGALLAGIGNLIAFGGAIWLTVIAYKKDGILWALLTFFIPCFAFYYAYKEWPETKQATLILLAGIAIAVVGQVLVVSSLQAGIQ